MKRSAWLDRLVAGTALVVLASVGCNDVADDPVSSLGPAGPDDNLPVVDVPGRVVSEPVVFPAGLEGSFSSGSPTGVSYISYAPGSVPAADSIEIRNAANASFVAAPMIGGGLDPVPIPASVGDTLETTILASGEVVAFARVPVPDESPPKVVRTHPARRSPRVPLNIRIKVIFTEPVSAPTVTSQTVRLLLDGQPVPATVSLSPDGVQAELIPDQPLQPLTTYFISVTTGVRDLAGDPLEQELLSEMTTAPPDLPGTIVFERGFSGPRGAALNIWSMKADGSGLMKLTNSYSRAPAISPDGTQITYISGEYVAGEYVAGDLSIMNVDGTSPRLLVAGGSPWRPEWSWDGSMIAFSTYHDTLGAPGGRSTNTDIFVVSISDGAVTRLTTDQAYDWGPSWSPDGGKIVFGSDRTGNWDLFVMDADGSNLTQLTSHPENDEEATWSPDGTRIIFSSYRNGNHRNPDADIYVMDADGSNVTQLTTRSAWDSHPVWSPGGTHIAYVSQEVYNAPNVPGGTRPPAAIWVMNADGSGKRRLIGLSPGEVDNLRPSWGP